jgi:UDP-2,3-diacylglucosamine pyrophosphatase LpxH
MIILGKEAALQTLPGPLPRITANMWQTLAHRRLSAVFTAAEQVPVDKTSKIIFFSDCHRGDNSKADTFARNEELYLHAMDHYYRSGFTYIEAGDGDEMWKSRRFSDIVEAHRRTFDLLHRFNRHNRLHIILGNHDIGPPRHNGIEKDGIMAQEGLILRHTETGQKIFVVHGHQADFKSDAFSVISRLAVRHVWRRVQLLDIGTVPSPPNVLEAQTPGSKSDGVETRLGRFLMQGISQVQEGIERRIITWIEAHQQTVICGHTHRPLFARHGEPPYFNTGSCVVPGLITGLELQNEELSMVQWSYHPRRSNGDRPQIKRELLTFPRKLRGLL